MTMLFLSNLICFELNVLKNLKLTTKKNVQENTPDLQDGNWKQVWNVTDATDEEIEQRTEQQANDVRAERNQLLSDCDWTQLADAVVDKQVWAEYRQALRDVPQQDGFPWDVEFPEQP